MKHLKESINIVTNMPQTRKRPSPEAFKKVSRKHRKSAGPGKSSAPSAQRTRPKPVPVITIDEDDDDSVTQDYDTFDGSGLVSDADSQTAWEVEKVKAKKVDADGNVHYLLKWKDGPDGEEYDDSWEPESYCDCAMLIRDFERKSANKITHRRKTTAKRNSQSSRAPSASPSKKSRRSLRSSM